MTDYTHSTGSAGTMMIRDTGTTVEFWLRCSSTSTFNHQLPWTFIVNGSQNSWLEFDFESGGAWQKLGYRTITYSQTVTFKLGDTGTSGLGGPTNFSQYISRATAPSTPSVPVISSITSTSVVATFTDGANNGAAIDSRQLSYGTDPGGSPTRISSDGSTLITGLTPGTTYYFWARTHNSEGYSPWSASRSAKTLNVPDATSAPILTQASQTFVVVNFYANGNGGSAITGYDIGFTLTTFDASGNPIIPGGGPSPSVIQASTGSPWGIYNLSPGRGYVFWVRAKNAVGAGPWSEARTVTLIAGARVLVGGVWRRAVPYVRVGGVWKLARPWVKASGVWKESS